jgi:hypothetical protein
MPKDKPKRTKFKSPKLPTTPMRADQHPIFGVGLLHERLVAAW